MALLIEQVESFGSGLQVTWLLKGLGENAGVFYDFGRKGRRRPS